MREQNISSAKTLNLGYQGEYGATLIIFDVDSWFTQYGNNIEFGIIHQRSEDTDPYVVNGVECTDDHKLEWTVDSVDTAYVGKGSAQIIATIVDYSTTNELITMTAKSQVYDTKVLTSLGQDTGTITATIGSINDIIQLKADVETIKSQTNEVYTNTKALYDEVTDTQTQMSGDLATLSALEEKVEDNISTFNSYLTTAQSKIDDLNTTISNAATSAADAVDEKLQSYVDQANEAKKYIDSEVSTIEEIKDFDTFKTNMETRTSTIETKLSNDEGLILSNNVEIEKIKSQLNIASSFINNWSSQTSTIDNSTGLVPFGASYGMIKKITGQSFEFNQMIPNGNFATNEFWSLSGESITSKFGTNEVSFTIPQSSNTKENSSFNLNNSNLQTIQSSWGGIYFQKIQIKIPEIKNLSVNLDFTNAPDDYSSIVLPADGEYHTYYSYGQFTGDVQTGFLSLSLIAPEDITISFQNAIRVNIDSINKWLSTDRKISSAEKFLEYFPDDYYDYYIGSASFTSGVTYYDSTEEATKALNGETATATSDASPIFGKTYFWCNSTDKTVEFGFVNNTGKKITSKYTSASFASNDFNYFDYYRDNTDSYCQIVEGAYGTGSNYNKEVESTIKRRFKVKLWGGATYTFSLSSSTNQAKFDTLMRNSTKNTSTTINLSSVAKTTSYVYYITIVKNSSEEKFDNLKVTITSSKITDENSVTSKNHCLLPDCITKLEDYCASTSGLKYSSVDLIDEYFNGSDESLNNILMDLHPLYYFKNGVTYYDSESNIPDTPTTDIVPDMTKTYWIRLYNKEAKTYTNVKITPYYDILSSNPFHFFNSTNEQETPGYGALTINYSSISGTETLTGTYSIPPIVEIEYGINTALATTAKSSLLIS